MPQARCYVACEMRYLGEEARWKVGGAALGPHAGWSRSKDSENKAQSVNALGANFMGAAMLRMESTAR